jgi:GNAT superfamily N-acetyltransferase
MIQVQAEQAGAVAIPVFRVESTIHDCRKGESFGRAFARENATDSPVAVAEFSIYKGGLFLKWIQTLPPYRRQGIATSIINHLKEEYPGYTLIWTATTEDGTAFRKAVDPPKEHQLQSLEPGQAKAGQDGEPTVPDIWAESVILGCDHGEHLGLVVVRDSESRRGLAGVKYQTSGEDIVLEWVQTPPPYRNKDIGNAVIAQIREKYPDKNLLWKVTPPMEAPRSHLQLMHKLGTCTQAIG